MSKKKAGRPIAVLDTQLADFPGEEWKDIPDFEVYLLSNYGRVKSVGRYVQYKAGHVAFRPPRILKLRCMRVDKTARSLMVQMLLRKDGKNYSCSVGRYVYHLFVAPIDLED